MFTRCYACSWGRYRSRTSLCVGCCCLILSDKSSNWLWLWLLLWLWLRLWLWLWLWLWLCIRVVYFRVSLWSGFPSYFWSYISSNVLLGSLQLVLLVFPQYGVQLTHTCGVIRPVSWLCTNCTFLPFCYAYVSSTFWRASFWSLVASFVQIVALHMPVGILWCYITLQLFNPPAMPLWHSIF